MSFRASPWLVVASISWMVTTGAAQDSGLVLAPKTPQHATAAAAPARVMASVGGSTTLSIDMAPLRGVHIYAKGAEGFTPLNVVPTPHPGVRFGTAVFPAPVLAATLGVERPVPVYREAFTVRLPMQFDRSTKGATLTLAAAINYQACDDRLCYPVASLPVVWTVDVR